MKSTSVACKRCGAELEPNDKNYGLCIKCAERDFNETKRYFRNRLVIGVILAILFLLLIGGVQSSIENMSPTMRTPELDTIANLFIGGKIFWAAIMFTLPFGYYHIVKGNGARVNEAFRAEVLIRIGSPGFGVASTNNESAGVLFFILGIITAPIVGPVSAIYLIIRAVRLRKYIVYRKV